MAAPPPARLLDLTRLVSRLDRGALTGIDRVELAYLRRFLGDTLPLFGLVRSPLGFLLLDRAGAGHVLARATGGAGPGRIDGIGWITRRTRPGLGRDEADLRRLALARCPRIGLAGMLCRHLPPGTESYLVGHADLTLPVLLSLRRGLGGRVAVLLHDTIPLDHPDLSRAGSPAAFAAKLRAVAAVADLVIYTSADARARAEPHLRVLGRVPAALVAPLGVELARADPQAVPLALRERIGPDRPLFLVLGTIEPRKNHALLLDLWQRMDDPPLLLLAGSRGWSNEPVFRRLDALAAAGGPVLECPGLGDGAVAALMDRAAALLFPSRVEGFGLPPVEAAARGLPVIAAPLPALREVLGDYPAYVDPADAGAWAQAIAAARHGGPRRPVAVPGWEGHFNIVLNPAC